MKTKNHSRTPFAAALAVATLITSAQAAVVFSTTGAASYLYSASSSSSVLPPASDATLSNITISRYTLFGAGNPEVRGLTNNGPTVGTATWHFQTGAGLNFSNNVNLQVGTGRNATGTVVGEYGYDNSTWTPWFSTTAVDAAHNATNVANGQTNLYVRFTFSGTTTGDTVMSWGGNSPANQRPFTLSGTVVPEPSTALLGGLGMLALLRRRR